MRAITADWWQSLATGNIWPTFAKYVEIIEEGLQIEMKIHELLVLGKRPLEKAWWVRSKTWPVQFFYFQYIYKEYLCRGILVQLRVPKGEGESRDTLSFLNTHHIGADVRDGMWGKWENSLTCRANPGRGRDSEHTSTGRTDSHLMIFML